MLKDIKSVYYRSKLNIWSRFHLPQEVFVADTNYKIPAQCWQVAIPCRTDTTQVLYTGKSRKIGRMLYEPEEFPEFKKLVKGKKTFFDVGANIGYYSFLAADGGIKEIVAFEFMAEYAEYTSKALKKNGIAATVINQGVGDPSTNGAYSDPLAKTSGSMISLDEYAISNNIFPDILKMDIEGAELDALKNAKTILSKKPALNISIHNEYLKMRGQDPKEIFELLKSYNYKVIWSSFDTYILVAD